MKRMIRKPTFWVTLIVGSFVLNLILAVLTLRDHWFYAQDPTVVDDPSSSHSIFLFPKNPRWTSKNNNKNNNNNNNNHLKEIVQIPESVLWRRLLQEEHTNSCGGGDGSRNLLRLDDPFPHNGNHKNKSLLPPFEFRHHIEQFLSESTTMTNKSSTTSFSSLRKPSSSSFSRTVNPGDETNPTCFLPPTTACDEERYSVVVYTQARHSRRLFLNLMSFQSYPSVGDITLLLGTSSSSTEFLFQNYKDKYAQRISQWNQTGTIRILLHTDQSSLWSSLANFYPNHAAVLFMNGDVSKQWNGTTLKATFWSWKQHSRSLIVGERAGEVEETSSTTSGSMKKARRMQDDDTSCPLNQLHMTMIHRNWLCFLRHPLLHPVQHYLTTTPTPHRNRDVLNGLGLVWNQLGDGHILLDTTNAQPPAVSFARNHSNENTGTTTIRTILYETNHQTQQQQERTMSTILNYFGCSCSVQTMPSVVDLTKNCIGDGTSHDRRR